MKITAYLQQKEADLDRSRHELPKRKLLRQLVAEEIRVALNAVNSRSRNR